jgi:D-alanyl-D-alanine carboxypeptidase
MTDEGISMELTQARSISEASARKLDGVLDRLLAVKGVRHALVAVERRDGSLSWAGARGMARPDGTAMTVETPFWIASITKLFIASVILKLHESGRLSIDDKVIRYLPERMLRGVHVVNGTDHCEALTVRHLLSHSSGIPDYLELQDGNGKTLIDRVLEGEDRGWTLDDVLQIVRESNKPLFPPQSLEGGKCRIRYSDTNFQMLIAIIERVTEQSVDAAFQELLCVPLHLRHTCHPGGQSPGLTKPAAAVWIQDVPFDTKPRAMRAFGDLNSTAADLITFMGALIGGKVFDRPETLELMRGTFHTFGVALSPIAPGWPIQYGLGMMRFQMPRWLPPFRSMPEVIGHTGAVGSWLFYCPKLDIITTGTVSQVTAAAAPFRVLSDLLRILEEELRS